MMASSMTLTAETRWKSGTNFIDTVTKMGYDVMEDSHHLEANGKISACIHFLEGRNFTERYTTRNVLVLQLTPWESSQTGGRNMHSKAIKL